MDDPNISTKELSEVFRDIGHVNLWLGGNRSIKKALDSVLLKFPSGKISLLDVGCGDGNALRYTARYLRKRGYNARLFGIDINNKAIALAREASGNYPEINYRCMDATSRNEDVPQCDIVMSTLTMHHMQEEQIQNFIEACQSYCTNTVIINDLQRSALAYYLFKFFGAIFIKTTVARKDGLLSIRKGFTKAELLSLSKIFKDWDHTVCRKWAFRFVWVLKRKRQIN